jgi:hypothetical protein
MALGVQEGNISKIENVGGYYILYLWWQATKKSKKILKTFNALMCKKGTVKLRVEAPLD